MAATSAGGSSQATFATFVGEPGVVGLAGLLTRRPIAKLGTQTSSAYREFPSDGDTLRQALKKGSPTRSFAPSPPV